MHLRCRAPCRDEGDDAAAHSPVSGSVTPGQAASSRRSTAPKQARGLRCVHADRPRITHRHAQGRSCRHGSTPSSRTGVQPAHLVAHVGHPVGRMEVEEDRLHAFRRGPAHIEKAGAARPAQELAAGGRQHVAAERLARRSAAARPTGRHRADRACRARGRTWPTSAAGLTSPPLVGTCVMAISLTRPSIMPLQRVDIELAAAVVVGTTSIDRARACAPPAGRRCSCWTYSLSRSGCGHPA